jgi:hypothetical protein
VFVAIFGVVGYGLRPDSRHQGLDADDVHDPGEIIGQHCERYLGADILQPLHQKVGRAHAHLDGARKTLRNFSAAKFSADGRAQSPTRPPPPLAMKGGLSPIRVSVMPGRAVGGVKRDDGAPARLASGRWRCLVGFPWYNPTAADESDLQPGVNRR